jgi:hypothetical protein
MEAIIQLNQDYQILICRLCQSAVRPGNSIKSHFRQKHQLKGQMLRDIKDYYGTLALAGPKLTATPYCTNVELKRVALSSFRQCQTRVLPMFF